MPHRTAHSQAQTIEVLGFVGVPQCGWTRCGNDPVHMTSRLDKPLGEGIVRRLFTLFADVVGVVLEGCVQGSDGAGFRYCEIMSVDKLDREISLIEIRVLECEMV